MEVTTHFDIDGLRALNIYVYFRVNGHGIATILEVTTQTKAVSETEAVQSEQEKDLRSQLKDIETQITLLEPKKSRLQTQRKTLDGFADSLAKTPVNLKV